LTFGTLRIVLSGNDHRALGRGYLERAVQLDPGYVQARASLASAIWNERTVAIGNQLRAAGALDKFDTFSDATYVAVAALPLSDRLFYLPLAAESAYMRAQSIEFTSRDKPEDQKAEAHASLLTATRPSRKIERPRLLKDAEQIRAGTMPQAYQYAEARR